MFDTEQQDDIRHERNVHQSVHYKHEPHTRNERDEQRYSCQHRKCHHDLTLPTNTLAGSIAGASSTGTSSAGLPNSDPGLGDRRNRAACVGPVDGAATGTDRPQNGTGATVFGHISASLGTTNETSSQASETCSKTEQRKTAPF